MAKGDAKEQGPHAYKRFQDIRKVIDDVADTLKNYGSQYNYWGIFFVHDVMNDARMLTEFATRWEDHCRKTGQNPFRFTNEDGTPDTGSTR